MDREVLVYVEIGGVSRLAGRMWSHVRNGKQSATFQHDPDWFAFADHLVLKPLFTPDPGPSTTTSGNSPFGAIGDSAPNRWGRTLMRRFEQRRAERTGVTSRTVKELDFLLGVDDRSRQGALRFAGQEGGLFLSSYEDVRVPSLVDLPQLLSAAANVVDDTDSDSDLQLLVAPGASLGGARPKVSIKDRDGHLVIAKFPHRDDQFNTVLWEGVALSLAAKSGIMVPDWRIEYVLNEPVLLLRRFDRNNGKRVAFLSAMSMIEDQGYESRSYLEFVDTLRRYGASPVQDMHELWRRIVFNVLISNTDDHLRNHAFLYSGSDGWRLSPAYDLNPVPTDIKPRILTTCIDLDYDTASLDLAMSVAGYFELSEDRARAIAAEVGMAVRTWRTEAARLGLKRADINRMTTAFEHEDLRAALSVG